MPNDSGFLANTADCSRETIERFVTYATNRIQPLRDGRIPVVYPFAMVDYIGHYAFDAHAIRSLFPPDRYQIFWLCPPGTRPINRAMVELVTHDIVRLDVADFPVDDLARLAVTIFFHSWAFQFGDHIFAFGGISRSIREQYHRHLGANGRASSLRLTADEEEKAEMSLRSAGIDPDSRLVVIHVREGGYNTRDSFNSFRDNDIRNYDPAIELLVKNGLTVVRVGDASMRPLAWRSRQVVDLATKIDKDPAIDGYAMAKCDFMLHTSSGPTDIGRAFGKPMIATNFYFSEYIVPEPGDLLLPKAYVSLRDGSSLSLPDILNRQLTFVLKDHQLADAGVRLQENAAEDIEAACLQFLALRRDGDRRSTPAQSRYEAIHRKESELRRQTGALSPEQRYCPLDVPGALIAEAALHRTPGLLDGELLPPPQRPAWPPIGNRSGR